jgi:hypothetical protein
MLSFEDAPDTTALPGGPLTVFTRFAPYTCQVTDAPGATPLMEQPGGYDIELRDVTFGYRQDQAILQVWARCHRHRVQGLHGVYITGVGTSCDCQIGGRLS